MLSIILVAVFLFLNVVLGKNIVSARRENLFTGNTVIYLLLGLVISTSCYLFTKYFAAPWWLSLLPVAISFIFSVVKQNVFIKIEKRDNLNFYIVLFALYVAYILPVLIQGIRMGTGPYPKEFYCVDTPFYLGYVHALLQQNHIPVTSLEDQGFVFDIQYGPSGMAALFCKVSGMLPHKSFVLLLPMVIMTVYFVAALKICRFFTQNSPNWQTFLFLSVMLFGSQHYGFNYLIPYKVKHHFLGAQYYKANFPLITALTGKTIALVWLYTVLKSTAHAKWRLPAAILAGLLVLFKIAYVPNVLIAYGCIALYAAFKVKKIAPLAYLLAAAIVAVVCYKLFSPNATSYMSKTELHFAFPGAFAASYSYFYEEGYLFTILLFIVPAAVGIIFFPAVCRQYTDFTAAFCVLPICIISCVLLVVNNNGIQLYSLLPIFAGVLFIGVSSLLFKANSKKLARTLVVAYMLLLTSPGCISEAHYIGVLFTDKKQAHEYVDNRSLADVLAHAPVQGTVIAINDRRYPAENYARIAGNFALPAIYGQQFYGCNLAYVGFTPTMLAYKSKVLSQLNSLQSPIWNEDSVKVTLSFANTNVTHVLIHKTYSHASNIPLPLIYQNNEYAIYKNIYP